MEKSATRKDDVRHVDRSDKSKLPSQPLTSSRSRGRSGNEKSGGSGTSGGPGLAGGARGSRSQGTSKIDEESYGIIVTIKDTFGFIQPFVKDEQIFVSLRDLPAEARVGDEVSYRERTGPKGLSADRLKQVPKSQIVQSGLCTGIITREIEPHRGTPGCIRTTNANREVDKNIYVVFFDDVNKSSSRKIMKGDEVEFSLARIEGTSYARGSGISIKRTKREMALADQIQRMLEAGSVKELGVVDTIRGDYGFIKPQDRPDQIYFRVDDVVGDDVKISEGSEVSFIVISEMSKGRIMDRAMHLEVQAPGAVCFETLLRELAEGTVTLAPVAGPQHEDPGRVRLHQPICVDEKGDVVAAPFSPSAEANDGEVGQEAQVQKSRSSTAATKQRNGGWAIWEVELWARCLADHVNPRVGDVITMDVQYYRPEKLQFARSVRIKSYRMLGREFGVLCAMRDPHYGFISCFSREADVYFRTADVVTASGDAVTSDAHIGEGTLVSFEVGLDDSASPRGGGSSRLRAHRIVIIDNSPPSRQGKQRHSSPRKILTASTTSGAPDVDVEADGSGSPSTPTGAGADTGGVAVSVCSGAGIVTGTSYPVRKSLRGVVVRESKSNAPGLIKITGSAPDDRSAPLDASVSIAYSPPPELVIAVNEFVACEYVNEIQLEWLTTMQRKVYHDYLDQHHLEISHETLEAPVSSPSRGGGGDRDRNSDHGKWATLRLRKRNPEEVKALQSTNTPQDLAVADGVAESAIEQRPQASDTSRIKGRGGGRDRGDQAKSDVFFLRTDVNEERGPLDKGLQVELEVHLDRKTNKFVGRNIRLTDDPISGLEGKQFGVLEVVVSAKTGLFGYLRSLPTDEKLFWHASQIASGDKNVGDTFDEGREVQFSLRSRGGRRTAVDVEVLPAGSLSVEEMLEGRCLGLVVEPGAVVLIDVSACAPLASKYWTAGNIRQDLEHAEAAMSKSQQATGKSTMRKIDVVWEKVALEDPAKVKVEEGAVVTDDVTATAEAAAAASLSTLTPTEGMSGEGAAVMAGDIASVDNIVATEAAPVLSAPDSDPSPASTADEVGSAPEGAGDVPAAAAVNGNTIIENGAGVVADASTELIDTREAVVEKEGDAVIDRAAPEEVEAVEKEALEISQPKYFDALTRCAVPILKPVPDGAEATSGVDEKEVDFLPGEWVECNVVVNWAQSRGPLGVCHAERVPSLARLTKRRGAIARTKVRHKPSTTAEPQGAVSGSGEINDLCEIKAVDKPSLSALMGNPAAMTGAASGGGKGSESNFYCSFREVIPCTDTSRDNIQLGDWVEFFPIDLEGRVQGLAVGVTMIPKNMDGGGINFRRAPVAVSNSNSNAAVKKGIKSIIMAKGPSENGDIGFAPEWREHPDCQGLPWAHLLPHMIK